MSLALRTPKDLVHLGPDPPPPSEPEQSRQPILGPAQDIFRKPVEGAKEES